jgi:multidrug efflux system membrane fusion protein
MSTSKKYFFGIICIVILAVWGLHKFQLHHVKHRAGVEVVVCTAKTANVPVYLFALGTVTPNSSVIVRTQVNGQLLKILFHEGQEVKAGQLLAEIDPRPFEAQVLEFEGQLARDSALLSNAKVDLKRYQTLYKLNSVSQQIFATQKSLVKQLEGTVKIDQGQLDNAKVNLGYCKIISPINGRIGLEQVNPGNTIQTSDANGIAVINTINPMTVVFTLPEDDIEQVEKQIYGGVKLHTEALDKTKSQVLSEGYVSAIDSQIDPTTGTVKLKAEFDNHQNQLFPNQFVNIKLLVKTLQNVVVLPTAAIQQGANGPFVYIVNTDGSMVNVKSIQTGVTEGDFTVITQGITSGQTVVLEGADLLSDGASVTIYRHTTNNKQSFPRTKT